MQLPETLHPWRDWLSWLPADLAPELGELVRRIDPLLGRFRGKQRGGEPEPDGLGDLHRRGPYDRLLSSEWLLAEEIPDEFLRRAASGEHLFLAPRPRSQQADRLIVALFDAGPHQLGAPRLAHLALWILLARRAREAGGELRWGVLQDPGKLYPAEAVDDLLQLLKARTYQCASAADWDKWQEAVANLPLPAGECWLLGHALPDAALRNSRCTDALRLSCDLAGEALELTMGTGPSSRVFQLPLPPQEAAVRLLQGRFKEMPSTARQVTTSNRLSLTHPPVLSRTGKHVAVKLLDEHGAMIFQLPRRQSQEDLKQRRQVWPKGGETLAVQFNGKNLGGLLVDSSHLHFWQFSGLNAKARPPREKFVAAPGRAGFLPSAWLRQNDCARLYALDQSGQLVFWVSSLGQPRTGPAPGTTHQLAQNVLALAPIDAQRMVYARRLVGQLVVTLIDSHGIEQASRPLGPAGEDAKVLFGHIPSWYHLQGAVAVQLADAPAEHWRVIKMDQGQSSSYKDHELSLPAGWSAIGLFEKSQDFFPALVLLSPNRNALALFTSKGSEALYMSPSRIVKYSFCPINGFVAMLTEERELIVYSVGEQQVKMHIHSAGASSAS